MVKKTGFLASQTQQLSTINTELYTLEDIQPVEKININKYVQEAIPILSVICEDWETRTFHLNRIHSFIIHEEVGIPELISIIKELKEPLGKQLEDKRSLVIKSVCGVLSHASSKISNKFELFVDYFLPILFKLTYVTIQIMSWTGNKCIEDILKNTSVTNCNIIPKMSQEILSGNNAQLRGKIMSYLLIILKNNSKADLDKHSTVYYNILKKAFSDSSPEVRSFSRQTYWIYHSHFKKNAQKLYDEIDKNVKKALDRENPNLNTNSNQNLSKIPKISTQNNKTKLQKKRKISQKKKKSKILQNSKIEEKIQIDTESEKKVVTIIETNETNETNENNQIVPTNENKQIIQNFENNENNKNDENKENKENLKTNENTENKENKENNERNENTEDLKFNSNFFGLKKLNELPNDLKCEPLQNSLNFENNQIVLNFLREL